MSVAVPTVNQAPSTLPTWSGSRAEVADELDVLLDKIEDPALRSEIKQVGRVSE